MGIVTGFETSVLEDTRIDDDFPKIFKALKHNLEVAENVFARVAKKQFRSCYDGAKLLESNEVSLRPIWTSEASITISMEGDLTEVVLQDKCGNLHALVKQLSDYVISTMGTDPLTLVLFNSLRTRIHKISDIDYRFVIKQKWGWRG